MFSPGPTPRYPHPIGRSTKILRDLWAAKEELQAYRARTGGGDDAEPDNESALACSTIKRVIFQDITLRERRLTAEFFMRHPSELNGGEDDAAGHGVDQTDDDDVCWGSLSHPSSGDAIYICSANT
ncbi:hypothetical protein EsH8_XI_000027 [Colletotrichum jinshuiense]